MSGLVIYQSSSDEENASGPVEVQTKVGSQHAAVNGIVQDTMEETRQVSRAHHDGTTNGESGALLGPTMPEDASPSYEETSEQDIIRHLTQASQPMTSIPDSPPGSPDSGANARIQRFLELKAKGVHFNEDLARKAMFRNPSLPSTMMKRAGVEEDENYVTSLPKTLWDPQTFPPWAYKEALLQSQQALHEKREVSKKVLLAAGKRTIEFASASSSAGSSHTSTPSTQTKRRRP